MQKVLLLLPFVLLVLAVTITAWVLFGSRRARSEELDPAMRLVEKGKALWTASCPVAGEPLCLKIVPPPVQMCRRPGSTSRLAVARHPGKARAAQRLFARALAAGGPAAAQASFLRAEGRYDDFLQVPFPSGLSFGGHDARAARAQRAFSGYLERKGALLQKALADYQQVVALKDAVWSIAAMARIGQLHHYFADALATAAIPEPPIPKSLTEKPAIEEFVRAFSSAYCETIREKLIPIERKAIESYQRCEQKARELGVGDGAWAGLCNGELARIRKEGFTGSSAKP